MNSHNEPEAAQVWTGVNVKNAKRDLKREYKQNPRPMGVYQIRNLVNGKILIGSAADLPGILNSQKFQLSAGKHPNRALQSDWKELGADSFSFETLDELSPTAGSDDYREELASLRELWLEKLQPYGDRGYNNREKSRDERLRPDR